MGNTESIKDRSTEHTALKLATNYEITKENEVQITIRELSHMVNVTVYFRVLFHRHAALCGQSIFSIFCFRIVNNHCFNIILNVHRVVIY